MDVFVIQKPNNDFAVACATASNCCVNEVKALACVAANQRYLNGNFLPFQMINGRCLSRKASGANSPIERVDLTMREKEANIH